MSKEHTTEHLRAELKSLSDTLEEVLSSSGEKSKEELSKIRSKAEQALKQSRYRLGETGDEIEKQKTVEAARAEEYVRAKQRTRKGPVKAFWASGSELFPSWLKWWRHVCGWRWWSWKRKKRISFNFY